MAFTVEQVKELYLLDTNLENIFINEFLTAAPGDYVKVYLLGLMCARAGVETDNGKIAKQLAIEEEDVLKAWNYWEGLGIVKKNFNEATDKFRYDVEFLSMKELLYGKKNEKKDGKDGNGKKFPAMLNDPELQSLYQEVERLTGRFFKGNEPLEIASWISDFGASPQVIARAYAYCVKDRKKDDCKYVGAVIKGWMEKGLKDTAAIDSHLQEVDERYFLYKRVMKAMGFPRNPTEKEKRLMDAWFDEMGMSMDTVLEACDRASGIGNPNFNYLNKVLVNWFAGKQDEKKSRKTISIGDVHKYYDIIRKKAEDEAAAKKEKIYSQIPKISGLDEELRLCSMEMSKIMVSGSGDKKQLISKYKNKADGLLEEKNRLLSENGYGDDYMDTKYRCEVCRDTGVNDNGERCICFKTVQNEAELWQKSLRD